MSEIVWLAVAVLFGYLLGSIPSGLLIGRAMGGVDIRQTGSGRTGATNAMRSLGAKGFALTFAADAGKAIATVLVARALVGDSAGPMVAESAAAVAAIVGHNWSVYIGFGGGRGMASGFGAMLALFWPSALVGLVVGVVLIALSKYVSLGSIGGTIVGLIVAAAVVVASARPLALGGFAVATAFLVIWSHRDNIERLLAGTERRIGQRV